jgi:DNA-binding transcriptional LysR family regulator
LLLKLSASRGLFRVNNIDLRLLAIVSELHKTRSVSEAAEHLGLSQSAVSMSLAKLRKHFNDPIFVRTSSGMEPTPHAADLIQLLKRAEEMLQTALGHHVVFDPMTSDRVFHLYSTDIAQVTLLPRLLARLKDVAPSIRIDLRRISEATSRLLESGAADVAVGFIQPMGAGFCQQSLFKEKFVCAMRRNHPRVRSTLTLEQFQGETHLAVATSGTGHAIIDKTLDAKGIRRNIGLTVPSFLGIASILTATDYLVILPGQLAAHLSRPGNIQVLPLPFHLPSYVIMQAWHERYTHDPAVRWFRGLIVDLFSELNDGRSRNSTAATPFREGDGAGSPEKTKLSANHHVA